MIETALLERGILGIVVLALGLAVVRLYNELNTQRDKHQKDVYNLQVTITEANRDHTEQLIEAHKDFTNRLLSLVTSDAETRERLTHSISELTRAFRQIEQTLDESSNIDRKPD
jgi:hypothetical protein